MLSRLQAQHKKVNSLSVCLSDEMPSHQKCMGDFERPPELLSQKVTRKIKSICLESEPILEELEEYLEQEVDQKNHTFVVTHERPRFDSIGEGN